MVYRLLYRSYTNATLQNDVVSMIIRRDWAHCGTHGPDDWGRSVLFSIIQKRRARSSFILFLFQIKSCLLLCTETWPKKKKKKNQSSAISRKWKSRNGSSSILLPEKSNTLPKVLLPFPHFLFRYLLFYISINSRNVCADVKSILNNDDLYKEAASEAFLFYNKSHLISLPMSNRSGDVTLSLSLSLNDLFS